MLTVTAAQLQAWLAAFLWPFLRVLALVGAAPVIGHRSVPARVKIGLALLITLLVAPTLPPAPAPGGPGTFALVVQQLLIGFSLAFAMHVAFAAVQLAGDLIGLQMGLSFAAFIDPAHSGQSPLLGMALGLFGTLVFLSIDGHLMLIDALARSFAAVPVGDGPGALPADLWQRLIDWGGASLTLGFHLALPVLAAMIACNLALGALARAAPQLNLFAVGFPAALAVGFLALILLMPYLAGPLQAILLRGLALLP